MFFTIPWRSHLHFTLNRSVKGIPKLLNLKETITNEFDFLVLSLWPIQWKGHCLEVIIAHLNKCVLLFIKIIVYCPRHWTNLNWMHKNDLTMHMSLTYARTYVILPLSFFWILSFHTLAFTFFWRLSFHTHANLFTLVNFYIKLNNSETLDRKVSHHEVSASSNIDCCCLSSKNQ